MKKAMLFLALLLTASATFAQKESDKTLVKTMDPKGTSSINFDFRNKGVESVPWDEGTIRIELEITANFPEAVLGQLVKAGRYTLSSEIDGEKFTIKAKNLEKAVSIGGTDLDDHVRIFIKTPGYYAVSDGVLEKSFSGKDVAAVVARSGTMEEATEMIAKMRKIKENVNIEYRFVYVDSKNPKKGKEAKDKTDSKTSAKGSKDKAAGSAGFVQDKKKGLPANSTLKEVQSLYGDIIIGGLPIDDFED
jgi:hypothetical protein